MCRNLYRSILLELARPEKLFGVHGLYPRQAGVPVPEGQSSRPEATKREAMKESRPAAKRSACEGASGTGKGFPVKKARKARKI